jgi:Zn-dependent metalloprotease
MKLSSLSKNFYCTFILFIVPLITPNNSMAQDTTYLQDEQGKVTAVSAHTGLGYQSIYITHQMVRGRTVAKDSLNDKFYDQLGKRIIGRYSQILKLNSQSVQYDGFINNINQIQFHQTYGGVPVYGTSIVITVAGDVFSNMEAMIEPEISCDTVPKISSKQAFDIVYKSNSLNSWSLDSWQYSTPVLTILPRRDEMKPVNPFNQMLKWKPAKPVFYLTWMIPTNSKNDYTYFVNALDGTIVWTSFSIEQ